MTSATLAVPSAGQNLRLPVGILNESPPRITFRQVERGTPRAGMQVTMDLLDVETPTGTNIGQDLYVAFGMPTLEGWNLPSRTDE
jgi:hypothetical protein